MKNLVKFDLKQFRKTNGLKQNVAAEEFGVDVKTWGRYERSGKAPRLWTLAIDGWLARKTQPPKAMTYGQRYEAACVGVSG